MHKCTHTPGHTYTCVHAHRCIQETGFLSDHSFLVSLFWGHKPSFFLHPGRVTLLYLQPVASQMWLHQPDTPTSLLCQSPQVPYELWVTEPAYAYDCPSGQAVCKVSQSLRAGGMSGSFYSSLGCVTAWPGLIAMHLLRPLYLNPVALGTPSSF